MRLNYYLIGVLLAFTSTLRLYAADENTYFSRTASEIRTSLTRAIEAIEEEYGSAYQGEDYLARLKAIPDDDLSGLQALQREALLANPTLDFDDVLLIRREFGERARKVISSSIGVRNGNFNSIERSKRSGWKTSIALLRDAFEEEPQVDDLFKSPAGGLIIDAELSFDAKRIFFSMPNSGSAYRLWELDGSGEARQISPDDGIDVDHSDPCFLPDGNLIFSSTATFLGMPCINGDPRMASLYRLEVEEQKIRQLGFDQDTSWYPTLLHDGRVIFSRWDYSDMVHSNNRPIIVMNPDGSGQRSYMFTNSYFPASFFFARPIPGHPSALVGIATGHHGTARMGRMLLVDPALGVNETEGVIQELPGFGKTVEASARDPLATGVWPLITHPYPLAQSETNKGGGDFFLVSMKPDKDSLWGIYLIDRFDNAVLLHESEGQGFFEPIAYKARPAPPVIPSLIKPESDMATLYIQDIYEGPGLKDVPRGTVKQLRIGSYQFSIHGGGGGHVGATGLDSGWDIKTIIGVTPVNEDGSVTSEIPAKTPLFFQPLDEEGRAVQGMRTWVTAMGGERMSCVGCHESANEMPRPRATQASRQEPESIIEWLGPERPMSFVHEVQPILDNKCVSCHDGQAADGRYQTYRPEFADGIPDFRHRMVDLETYQMRLAGSAKNASKPSGYGGLFSESYVQLHNLVRHPGIESPMAVQNATEFGSASSELAQLLRKGHHGVELTKEEWARLNTWMDYNAPYHGYRRAMAENILRTNKKLETSIERGNQLSMDYANRSNFVFLEEPPRPDVETLPAPDQAQVRLKRERGKQIFRAEIDHDSRKKMTLELGGGEQLDVVPIPTGSFVMGSSKGELDELPMHDIRIEKPFYMAATEVTNKQLRLFMEEHSSRYEDRLFYQFGQRGLDVDGDELPAVRVSWQTAMAFCEWLSKKTGKTVRLPTEAEWEWAARAGSSTPFYFADALDADFSAFANLADKTMELFAEDTAKGSPLYTAIEYIPNPSPYEMWIPHTKAFDDGARIQVAPASYEPNAWGLYDMHGNVSEWTASSYRPYPFTEETSSVDDDPQIERVVRGGSYRDRPYRATASHRLMYRAWQKVHDVGFRVVVED